MKKSNLELMVEIIERRPALIKLLREAKEVALNKEAKETPVSKRTLKEST
jgi:hypothetical protein